MSEIEKIVIEVDSSMAMEGLSLTEEDKNRIKYCLENPNIVDQLIQDLLQKHTVPANA